MFESTMAAFGEQVAFPEQILFAPASFREGFDLNFHRAAAESNVRMCDFFVQMLGEVWPGPGFQNLVNLTLECIADASKPMRQASVLFRNPDRADEQVLQFRSALAGDGKCDVGEFRDAAELERKLKEIYAGWFATVKETP